MLHLYSLIWYKNYVRSTDIVRVISGCFCSYSSMKLLVCRMCNIATILSLYEVMTIFCLCLQYSHLQAKKVVF